MPIKNNILFLIVLFAAILQCSCSDKKKEDMLAKHLQKSEFKNFKIQPELDIYLSLLQSKTNTSLISASVECQFLDNSDSILNYFTVELNQDSVEDNLGNVTKSEALAKIAVDIKPMVEENKIFQGITLRWTTRNQLAKHIGTENEISYQQTMDKIPNGAKYKFQIIKDTVVFDDYYYNGQQAYSGKILNDKRFGYWKYWWPNGQIKKEGQFYNDEKVGEWTYKDEAGHLQK